MSDVAQDKILLEIVTPKGRALSEIVDEVTAPAQDGEFGVLPGHLPMLAGLRTGIVSYRQGSGEPKKCAVGAGFVEAGANKVLILTDEYIVRSGVDPVIVRSALADVQSEIQKTEESGKEGDAAEVAGKLATLIAKENWLAAQLELYGDPAPATMRPYEEYGPPNPVTDDELSSEPPANN
jgi:F-type H+-transporting ATPase subunit epsilon